jgi:SAM-dependent methyltransferase
MNQTKIWSYFQNERTDVFSDATPRLRFLAAEARKWATSQPCLVLNIGVGSGFLEEVLLREGWSVRSVDPDEEVINKLQKKGREGDVGTIEALPYEASTFDVVFCSEVLEHLSAEETDAGLREICRVLKAGGLLLGTVPDRENLNDNIVVCPDCGQVFHRWGHQQHFDRRRLANLFSEVLTAVLVKPKLFIRWDGLTLKRRIAAVIKLVLFSLGSHGSNETLYFIARK